MREIKRQVIVKGQVVEALFAKDGPSDFLVRIGDTRFAISRFPGYWQAHSLQVTGLYVKGVSAFDAYSAFVTKVMNTDIMTGADLGQTRLPVATPGYSDIIIELMNKNTTPRAKELIGKPGVTPQELAGGIEYWMRLQHRTLDHLSRAHFKREVDLGLTLIGLDLAKSPHPVTGLRSVLASYK